MTEKRFNEIIHEAINGLEYLEKVNGENELTPWDEEGKMDRMMPGNAAQSKGTIPTSDWDKLIHRGYIDWKENYKDMGMGYPEYCQRFGVRR